MIMKETFPKVDSDGNVKRMMAPSGSSATRSQFQTLTQSSQMWDLSPRANARSIQNFQSQISTKSQPKKAFFPYEKKFKTISTHSSKRADFKKIQHEDSIESNGVNADIKPVMAKRLIKTRVPILNL